jgi:hypothetical protein
MLLNAFFILLFSYVILVAVSGIFIWNKRSGQADFRISFALPVKTRWIFRLKDKVIISHYITRYECPACGFQSHEHTVLCPNCLENGHQVEMKVLTKTGKEQLLA